MKTFFKFILKAMGWKVYHPERFSSKSVVAVLPHTSYWDGIIGYIVMRSLGINFKVISAEWLFFWPFKYIMKYVLHAFPVGKNSGNAITKSLKMFKENDKMNLIICPEGQLAPTDKWNPGFYVIAKKANVPVDVAIFDYWNKNIYIESFDISNIDAKSLLVQINRLCVDYASAKYPNKFKLHNIN